MAKLLKLRRGTTSQHSSFTGAEGEVTIDTTKDTAVIHDGSQAGGRPLLREDMSNLPAGTIDNADISNSAAIAGTKISPDFGSQNITTTGTISAGNDITLNSSGNNKTLQIKKGTTVAAMLGHIGSGDEGFLTLKDGGTDTLVMNGESGGVSYINSGNFAVGKTTASQKLDVNGNIAVSGTVDGRDVASDGSKLDGIESGATADQSASEILTSIKTVDGSGSGLDADLLDGNHAGNFVSAVGSDTLTGSTYTFDSSTAQKIILPGANSPYIRFQEGTTDRGYIQFDSSLDSMIIVNQQSGEYLRMGSGETGLQWYVDNGARTVWTSGNDGSGSGLDADLCDGLHVSNAEGTNTIVARNSSGYVFASYFNASGSFGTSGNTSGMGIFIGTNGSDTYARSYSAAAARSLLNVANGANNVTNNNQLTNGAGYITSSSLSSYMPKSGGTFTGQVNTQNFIPTSNNSYDLGSSSYRYRNIYTNDLHLSNEGSSNDVDSTWGDWTIQEGESDLFLKNNRSGKKFKFNLTEVS